MPCLCAWRGTNQRFGSTIRASLAFHSSRSAATVGARLEVGSSLGPARLLVAESLLAKPALDAVDRAKGLLRELRKALTTPERLTGFAHYRCWLERSALPSHAYDAETARRVLQRLLTKCALFMRAGAVSEPCS